jgi:transposase
MSLPKPRKQRSFVDVSFVAGDLFDKRNRYRLFREKILPALESARDALSELYCEENGRPAVDPVLMAGVSLLQFMEKVPDRQASELVREHLGWKYALDLELGFKGFHPTSLVKFRNRLLEGEKPRVVFDAILERLREEKLIKKRSKQRLDSTHVLGLVSQMSRLQVIRETIRLTLKEIERQGADGDLKDWDVFEERYCFSQIDWKQQSKEHLVKKAQEAGQDAWRLIEWLHLQGKALQESPASQLLERVFHEQYETGEQGVRQRDKEGSGNVKNPHDPDAQWSTKDTTKQKDWVGYKAQISETIPETPEPKPRGEPTENFIIEITTTEAIASDLDGMQRNLEAQEQHGQERPPELYVDAGYVTDDTLAQSREEDRELVGPARPCPKKGKGFDADQFDVDISARKAVCPKGKTSTQCSLINDSYKGSSYYRFEWGSQCDACPSQKACTANKSGRRILCVGIHHDLLQALRREMKTEAFQKRMQQRNGIEGTISELARLGLRRSRYRGLAKTALANFFLGAACNVRRWLRLTVWNMENKVPAET